MNMMTDFMSDSQAHIFPGPTIQTYEGPWGPGTMALNSGTVPAIRGPLRPMVMIITQSTY